MRNEPNKSKTALRAIAASQHATNQNLDRK